MDKWGSIDFGRGGVEEGGIEGDEGRERTDGTMCLVCCPRPSDDVAMLIPTGSPSAPSLPSSPHPSVTTPLPEPVSTDPHRGPVSTRQLQSKINDCYTPHRQTVNETFEAHFVMREV